MNPSRLISIAGKAVLASFAAALLMASALAWWAGTEAALRWVADRAGSITGGHLVARGVEGSLYGPLQIESLHYATAQTRVEIKQARLDWSPWALLRRHVHITDLTLGELRLIPLAPATTEEPANLPESLRLPVSVSLDEAKIARIVFATGDSPIMLNDLAFSLHKPADDYQLKVSNLGTPWGEGQGDVSLADASPFALSSTLKFAQAGELAYQVQATVSGTLSRLGVRASADALGGQTRVDATLMPFEAHRPVVSARLEAQGIDPSLLRKDLPRNQISALVTMRSDSEKGFDGEIEVTGAQSGPWDQGRYPLRSMAARFAGDRERIDLPSVRLDFGQAGTFTGSGRLENQRLQLALSTRAFDPRGTYSTLRSMKLGGDIHVSADARTQALATDLRYQRYRLQLKGQHQDDVVKIEQALLSAGSASLRMQGTLALARHQRFSFAGALRQFDPAAFGDFPAARLNASFNGSGRLSPETEAVLDFSIADSAFRGERVAGQGRLNASAKRLWDSHVVLQVASNRLEARGSFGLPDDRLTLTLAADRLTVIDPVLAGRIHVTSTLTGSLAAPSGEFDIAASALQWGRDYRLSSLRARGRLARGLDGMLVLDATATALATPTLEIDQARVSARGLRTQHTLEFAARNADFDLNGQLAGGWHGEAGWRGRLQTLANRGRFAVALKAPATVEVAAQRGMLADASFDAAGGIVRIAHATYDAGALSTRGDLQHIAAADLQRIAAVADELKTDLRLGGQWQIEATDQANGRIELRRESGDVALPTTPPTALGLNRLDVGVDIVDNRLRARLSAQGAKLGEITADAHTQLSRRDGAWGIAGEAPLQGQARFAVPALAWAAPLVDAGGGVIFDGAVKAEAGVDGTVAQPRVEGSIQGERLAFALPAEGLRFTDGMLQARWRDDALHLEGFTLKGGDGALTGQGRLALKAGEPDVKLAFTADKLQIVSRPDRLLVLSGGIDATAVGKAVEVRARLKADRGLIELPSADVPSPSKDVVVLGRETAASAKGLPYAMQLAVDFDLGDKFFLKGRGLDAQLGGAIGLTSADGASPRANGSIRVVKGAYAAYGQRLEIERGILNFQGPVDNPGLDVVAMRRNLDVEAGVAITGSAQAPRVSLMSRPDVPDSEKLSWLVLGRGEVGSSGQDYNALQAAAGALLSAGQSVSLQQRIAQAAGLEEVGLKGSGGLETAVLTLGKRLSSRAYLSFERGLSSADTLVKVNYTLTRRVSVQAQAGSATAVDLFYTLSFR